MSFYELWLKRVLFSSKTIFQFSSLFSLLGLILAVASLTVALLAVNSFSSSLENILINQQGHLRIQAQNNVSKEELLESIAVYREHFSSQAVFLSFEGLIIKGRHFKGAFFEAIQDDKLKSLSFLKNNILEGHLESSEPFLVLGRELAEELKLSAGDSVTALASPSEDSHFSRKQAHFKAGAIADFGRYDWNSSVILMPLSFARQLSYDQVSGASLWLKSGHQIDLLKQKMENSLGDFYTVRSWRDIDRAFLSAVESDKKIIFFVLFILVVSAGFNISSSLFIQVFRRAKDISVLKAMGAKKRQLRNLFVLNGLLLGFIGSVIGISAGLLICYLLIVAQNKWRFIPIKAYQVNEIVWNWQSSDLLLIFIASLSIVILSSLLPAGRACKMSVKAGLSYD